MNLQIHANNINVKYVPKGFPLFIAHNNTTPALVNLQN